MKLRRSAAVVAVAALALAAPGSYANVKPQIVDPAGDAQLGQANYDIKSVTYEVAKKTDLQVTLEVAGAGKVEPGYSYQLTAETGCGFMYIFVYWRAASGGERSRVQFAECGPETPTGRTLVLEHKFSINGSKLVWAMPLKSLPKELLLGSWDEPTAYTALTEPTSGYTTADFPNTESTAIDRATGTSFKLK